MTVLQKKVRLEKKTNHKFLYDAIIYYHKKNTTLQIHTPHKNSKKRDTAD